MDKNPIGEGRQIPMDDKGLMDMLSAGPGGIESSVQGEIPLQPISKTSPQEAPPAEKAPVSDEGPDDEMRDKMILPDEKTKALLKAKYGVLRVVPIPYTRGDGKIQCYILRQLTRSQWRTMEDGARKIAENKPNVSPDEIFQEKVIATACVWPNLPEHEIASSPPGLVPTLFGIVQQMGLFFNPEAIMSVTFTL
jgi:hypothetical protein